MIALKELIPNAENPRKIDKKQMDRLQRSIKEFEKMMELRPMVVDDTNKILGGNMRFFALKEMGYNEIPDEWVKFALNLSEAEKKEFIIKDNVEFGTWDWDSLANWDLGELADWGLDVPPWVITKEAHEDNYNIPDEVFTNLKLGDLVEIGPHRLLCGDSTNPDDVAKLLNGSKPTLMVTDPPYGVNYDANWRNDAEQAGGKPPGGRAVMKVSNDDIADWRDAWTLSPAEVAYIWHAGVYTSVVQNSIEACGFVVRAQIIWVKNRIVVNRGSYHWNHEPCFYAVRKGKTARWIGDRKQTTVWEIDKPQKSETGHSTQKPVECMARPVRNHDGSVYDPFIGSGTTLIACHQLGRVLFAMDISPKYCQITIDRALAFEPTLVVRVNGEIYVPPPTKEE